VACASARAITSGTGRKGAPLPEVPPAEAVLDDPVKVLRAHHDAQGLRLTGQTACVGWLGERLNVGWAIDVLHPLAAGPSTGESVDAPDDRDVVAAA